MALSCNFCRENEPLLSCSLIPLICTASLWIVVFLFAGTATLQPFCQVVSRPEKPWFNCSDFHFKHMSTTYSTAFTQLRTKHWTPYKPVFTLLAHIMPNFLAWPWPSCPLRLAQVSAKHPTSHFSTPEHQCSALSAIPPLLAASLWARMSLCSVSPIPTSFCPAFLSFRWEICT